MCKVYTSYYRKMLDRHKEDNEVYIQVSRSLGIPFEGVDGMTMAEMIDADWSEEFGMFSDTLENYARDIDYDDLKDFADMIKELDNDLVVYILCFENLQKKYTKADEEKYNHTVKAGEYKKCHRTILAKLLNENYDLKITEYQN